MTEEDQAALAPTPSLFGKAAEPAVAAEEAQAEAMTAEAEETPVPVIETPVEAAESEVLTQGTYDYTEADLAQAAPPVDNDHVEDGATPFTEEEIAMNADDGVTGDDENTYPDDRAYAAAEVEAGNDVPVDGSIEPKADTISSADEAIDEAEAVNETMDALAVPAVEAPTDLVAASEAGEADVAKLSDEVPASEKSVEDLHAEREKIDAEIKQKQDLLKSGVIDQIKTVAAMYGITADELAEAMGGLKSKRKGVPAKPKYKDPATGVVWSGRGKTPAWIKGKDFSKFAI